ncbi:MAG: hypothetical protein AB1641_19620 [Thermodesulfobacteriota bacterium]
MPEYRHTFLFEPALWEARGVYYDAQGRRCPCEGRTLITHEPDLWINDGSMKILAEQPQEFHNRYEVVPFAPGRDHTTWRSYNPDLAIILGRFIIVEDAFISPWQSEDGGFWGTEFLVQVGLREYRSRGYAFKGEQKLSAWAVQLLRRG